MFIVIVEVLFGIITVTDLQCLSCKLTECCNYPTNGRNKLSYIYNDISQINYNSGSENQFGSIRGVVCGRWSVLSRFFVCLFEYWAGIRSLQTNSLVHVDVVRIFHSEI